MNPIALILFVILIFVLAVFFLGGAADRNHESCRSADPLDADREFHDPDIGSNVTFAPAAQAPPEALECGGSTPLSLSPDARPKIPNAPFTRYDAYDPSYQP